MSEGRLDSLAKVGGVLLLVVLVGVFAFTAVELVRYADEPPRLADVAPTAAPTAGETAAELEPQRRGAYDPTTRLLGVLAVVTPLVTTMVAYYFGQEKGAAQAGAAVREKQEAIDIASEKIPDDAQRAAFYEELRARNITVRKT